MEEPLRYQRTFGLDAGQLDELEARIDDILPEPWDKGLAGPLLGGHAAMNQGGVGPARPPRIFFTRRRLASYSVPLNR
jgi:hypothetical protein